MASLTDANGNDLLPVLEAVSRVATAKEYKRAKRSIAARRRAGEDCETDDEIEAAGLSPPPMAAKMMMTARIKGKGGSRLHPTLATSDGMVIKKLLKCAAVDLALESDSEGCVTVSEPSSKSLREWMGIGDAYFAPTAAEVDKYSCLAVPVDGYLVPVVGHNGSPLSDLQPIAIQDGMSETSSGYSPYEEVSHTDDMGTSMGTNSMSSEC